MNAVVVSRRFGALVAGVLALALTTSCVGSVEQTAAPQGSNASVVRVVDGDTIDASVVRVVDGDTIVADISGKSEKIRMIGFNTPESVDPRKPVECFGKEASARMKELLPPHTPIRLERDAESRDVYGRLLAYVYRSSDSMFVNLEMVSEGYAHVLSIAPNTTYADRFRSAERVARDATRGLWAACPLRSG